MFPIRVTLLLTERRRNLTETYQEKAQSIRFTLEVKLSVFKPACLRQVEEGATCHPQIRRELIPPLCQTSLFFPMWSGDGSCGSGFWVEHVS